ncbi:Flagellar hook protein FlgE [Planctomycetes bacterium MalM25]|nr:Flagellar hook protein FlgE [Planctomycetes bacterium MalM25]
MGLQSAMTTALTGLQAAETSIDVIGNNVANSNTVGFKSSEVVFATQFLQTQSIGSAPSDTNGGTNPRQIGLGVKVAQITPDFGQGTIEISSNPLDVAIQGDGFLVVQGGQGEPLYTRNGQLSLNSLNQIVTSTGNLLLGYGVNDDYQLQTATTAPITIPLGGERVAQETSEAIFEGVLNPTVEPGDLAAETASEIITDEAVERPDDENFDSTQASIRSAPSPGVAGTTVTGGATGLSTGVYDYRITYVDANGQETSASTDFSVTVTDPNEQIDLSGLPTESGGVATTYPQKNIYRTEAGGDTYYLVNSSPLAIADTTFTDTLDDLTLASQAELDGSAIDSGSYSYYVTYYNSATGDETRASEPLSGYAISDNDSSVRLDFTELSAPDNDQFNEVRIYRNAQGDTSSYYLVDTVPAPGSGGFVGSYIDKTHSNDLDYSTQLDFDGAGTSRASSASLLVDLMVREGVTGHTNIFQEGTLSFTGEVGGSDTSTQELDITATTTVQELMDFMHDALGLQTQSNVIGVDLPIGGGSIGIEDGVLSVTSNYGEENAVTIPLTAFRITPAGAVAPETVTVSFSETQEANGPGTTTEFLVYDTLGSPLTVRMTTVLEDADSNSTTYRWYATSGDSQPNSPDLSTVVGNGVMIFDSRGDLLSSPSARISIQRELTASESPLEITLDLDQVKSLAVTNSSGEAISSLNMTSQNGFPPGVLTDFLITESGVIQGQFSNGTQRDLGQLVMARFSNNQGLAQVGDSLFARSVNSGEALLGNPGEDGLGSITAGAVELSNTDIGQDLIEMILAQTQYQAGSRVISAAQELLDELLALQR